MSNGMDINQVQLNGLTKLHCQIYAVSTIGT
uniref:Uncharacterized protein n=1 Tax=Arundo donax TaxID=35708 RepID=A0A0A8Z7J2_ARUDO